jgi:hypothetical protein
VFHGVFIAEQVDGGGKSHDIPTTMVDVQTLFEVFLNTFLRSASVTHYTSLW